MHQLLKKIRWINQTWIISKPNKSLDCLSFVDCSGEPRMLPHHMLPLNKYTIKYSTFDDEDPHMISWYHTTNWFIRCSLIDGYKSWLVNLIMIPAQQTNKEQIFIFLYPLLLLGLWIDLAMHALHVDLLCYNLLSRSRKVVPPQITWFGAYRAVPRKTTMVLPLNPRYPAKERRGRRKRERERGRE